MSGEVLCLNVHAAWKCRHSGACCRAGWSIPVEAHARWITGSDWLEPDPRGVCPQFDEDSSLCRIHHAYGESMLPHSCHHFPRRALIDERGTFVTLSHYCPTAAALLVDEDRLAIVEHPDAFPSERGYEGLDARGEWPPLLRPDALFDSDSFTQWERYLIDTLGSAQDDVDTVLGEIARTAECLRAWQITQGELAEWTRRVLRETRSPRTSRGQRPDQTSAARPYATYGSPEAFDRVCDTIPAGLMRPTAPSFTQDDARRFDDEWHRHAAAALRYVGARAFGSWTAYQSRGIRTQIAELFVTASVLRVECLRRWTADGTLNRTALIEAVRAADWLLVHLADRSALVVWLGEVES